MGRYVQYFTTPFTQQQVAEGFSHFMTSEGFTLTNVKGEQVWKKGMGLLTAPQYLKLSDLGGTYVLEAWIKFALLPGVYVGEMGINGAFGAIPKKLLKDRVNSVFQGLQAQLISAPANNAPAQQYQQPQQYAQQQYTQPQQQQYAQPQDMQNNGSN